MNTADEVIARMRELNPRLSPTAQPTARRDENHARPEVASSWPSGLLEWAAKRLPGDRGIGDTLARIGTADARASLLAAACGPCANKQRWLNERYPY